VDKDRKLKLETVNIPAEGVTLAGLRYLPESSRRDTALLFTHGFTAGKYSLDILAAYLAQRGYEGLTFDLVGHKLGGSGGQMLHAEQAAENLRDALHWLRLHTEARNIVLIGHSMGAGATLRAAALERVAGVGLGQARLAGIVCMCIGRHPTRGFEGVIGKAMLEQRSDYVVGAPPLELLGQLDGLVLSATHIGDLPALFIAARQDALVSPERVAEVAAMVGPTATVATVDTSHLEAPDRARPTILQWLQAQGLG
jgi:pimeloyl-ACP methyl ester carboxylesterase